MKLRMLFVDDDPANFDFIVAKLLISGSPYEPFWARSVDEAIDMIAETHFELVFLDHDFCKEDNFSTPWDSARKERPGLDFVDWVIDNLHPDDWPNKVILHSDNSIGNLLMKRAMDAVKEKFNAEIIPLEKVYII